MKAKTTFASAVAVGMFGAALPAMAHIEYYDLNQGQQIGDLTDAGKAVVGNDLPISNPAFWSPTYQSPISSGETWASLGGSFASGTWGYSLRVVNLDSSGWTDGLRNNPSGGAFLQGDTHKVGWANFRLNQPSSVSITLTDPFGGSGVGLNPSFTLYQGSAVFQAHDDSVTDPLNPRSPAPPFGKIQNTMDTGSVVDSQGITSAFRDTVNNAGAYVGQFNALGDFSVGNPAGNWSAVRYVASVTGNVDPNGFWEGNSNSNSLLNFVLSEGDYIIAFSGNAQPVSYATPRSGDSFPFGTVTNLEATLTFTAVPVAVIPEPESWVMLLAGIAVVGGIARRRSQQSA